MRAVITRVKSASVSIAGSVVGEIGHGLLILLGVGPDDTPELCEKLADKALGLRIFCDEAGKMNRSLADIGGQVLVVSQFTLYADCRKGKRPSFTGAALPELAVPLYEQFLQECRSRGFEPQHGRFGADMLVASENDGPVTILLDTDELLQPKRLSPPCSGDCCGGPLWFLRQQEPGGGTLGGTSAKRTITLPRPEAVSRPIPIPARWGSPMRSPDD